MSDLRTFGRSLLAALAVASAIPAFADDGQALFVQNCSSCHGTDAEGIEGLAPPLHNPELWQALGDNSARYIAGVMTGGLSGTISAKGLDYFGLVMPPQSHIDSADLQRIARYVIALNEAAAAPDQALIDQLKAAPLAHKALRDIRKGN
ncbi:cytochrome c [Pseudomonas sp. ABC1]|uniref:c-type cytochrome n=1 Tax=Pseudomonas sp. ABC1 TaxID=2748080 RepID=UPI0015C2C84E|nr:cytochrome c [Pseudomonas sp. ABC1]QLF93723.1 cytochrome c [Pseudomonas sp. ABC1]